MFNNARVNRSHDMARYAVDNTQQNKDINGGEFTHMLAYARR